MSGLWTVSAKAEERRRLPPPPVWPVVGMGYEALKISAIRDVPTQHHLGARRQLLMLSRAAQGVAAETTCHRGEPYRHA